ncbi:hypothetical protein VNO78_31852 [Psophocarpus tetragonolobus]|uniref:Uncharacterized protein n=1 Tax=Psophocarpus tetragonolobus TaxID=3891 RepID=A0AAN9X847_PSOTE
MPKGIEKLFFLEVLMGYVIVATERTQYYAAQKKHDPQELLLHDSHGFAAKHLDLMGPMSELISFAYSPTQASIVHFYEAVQPFDHVQVQYSCRSGALLTIDNAKAHEAIEEGTIVYISKQEPFWISINTNFGKSKHVTSKKSSMHSFQFVEHRTQRHFWRGFPPNSGDAALLKLVISLPISYLRLNFLLLMFLDHLLKTKMRDPASSIRFRFL